MVWPAAIFPIHFFNINHYTACLSPKLCISIVFKFSWEDCKSQEKLETMQTVLLRKFFFGVGGGSGWGLNKVYYGNVKKGECPHAHFYVHTPRPPLTKKLLFFRGSGACTRLPLVCVFNFTSPLFHTAASIHFVFLLLISIFEFHRGCRSTIISLTIASTV